jgi:hypothetical protein
MPSIQARKRSVALAALQIDYPHRPVGNALLAHSVVTLDFHSMKIYVRPG